MIWHYLKVSLRNSIKHRGLSLINVVGLTIGITCCVLIMLWVGHERSFDQFHANGDDLHLVAAWTYYGSQRDLTSNTPPALAAALVEDYPEIVAATRFNAIGSLSLRYEDKAFIERCHAADASFLEMFTYPLIKGDAGSALSEPHSILMTEKGATKYFGEEDPLGQVIEVDGKYQFTVTGILAELPDNTSMRFEFLIPFPTLAEIWNSPGYPYGWTNWNLFTYVQLQPGASVEDVEKKIAGRITQGNPEDKSEIFLAPYNDLYMHGFGPVAGRFAVVVLISLLALFILLIACLNFMNIATARSVSRAREVGLRKVVGAQKRDLVAQFYGESFLLSFVSLVLALVLMELLLPLFNNIVGKQLSFEIIGNPKMVFALIGVATVTALIAGSYPSLYMSSFRPARIFTGMIASGPKRAYFIKGFVVFQFAVSIVLLVATFVIQKQLNYVQNRDLGFERTDLVYVQLKGGLKDHYETMKQEWLKHPDVLHVSVTSKVPTGVYDNGSGWEWDGRPAGTDPLVTYFGADSDFPETFQVGMVAGSYFSIDAPGRTSATSGEVLVNKRFAEIIGVENPVGMRLSNYGYNYTIIGVIENFSFKPSYWRVGPLLVYQSGFSESNPNRYNYMFARLAPGDPEPGLEHISGICKTFNEGFPTSIRFLEDDYGRMYDGEKRFSVIIRYAAVLMIFVACLGLFGLAAFTAEQRTREIGVRKVLGASSTGIVRLLCWQILVPVLIANVAAWATSYLFLSSWLTVRFAYRATIGWQPLILASVITLSVALISVGYNALRAALTNPADSLRHE
jgi:ABC-type antimicrobial peptide transport system permease subunit